MKIGYARVSTLEQNLDLQLAALEDDGCRVIYRDKASGASAGRKGLSRALAKCGPGDVLVAWKLDRLGRNLFDLVRLAEKLKERDAGLKILTGQGASIDTTRAEGRMIFGIFAALAEFERELIRERTVAGLQAAKDRGVTLGRPRKLTDEQVEQARALIESGEVTRAEAARAFEVDVATLRRAMKQDKATDNCRAGSTADGLVSRSKPQTRP